SIDGDNPAAMRYTEAKLQPLAMELLQEIRQQPVAFRPTFDGTLSEPVVLPARVSHLPVTGPTGSAVEITTQRRPHNRGNVVGACIYLIDSPNARMSTLVSEKLIQGPDFPTRGCILNTPEELLEIYETGEGAIHLRGEYQRESKTKIIVTSVPYGVNKADLV